MENIQFITHYGTSRPVPDGTYVIYRTRTNTPGFAPETISPIIHQPMLAENIDWSDKPVIGRIYEYAVVDEPKGPQRWVNSVANKKGLRSRGRSINHGRKKRTRN